MHILVTRPKHDAGQLISDLEARGHTVSHAPLLEIVAVTIPDAALNGAAGLIVTSRNALRALNGHAALPLLRDRPLIAVGDATAREAREMGFSIIVTGEGTAASLIPLIVGSRDLREGHLVHLAGDHVAFDLKGELAKQGVAVTDVVAYRSVAARTLPSNIAAALEAGELDAVILMSPRTAETWATLAKLHSVNAVSHPIVHICFSEAVAASLVRHAAPGISIEIASRPESQEVLALVSRLAENSRAT